MGEKDACKSYCQSAAINAYNYIRFVIHVLLHSFTYSGIQHDFNLTGCLCRLKVARRMPLLEKQFSSAKHLRTSL